MDTSIDIVKSAKKWVTWDDISKDLPPYLNRVVSDIKKTRDPSLISDMKKALNQSFIKDFCIMELIMPKVKDIFHETLRGFRLPSIAYERAYAGVVADIVKLYNNSDDNDLEKMLETQTQLLDSEKNIIREDWKNRHSIAETYENIKKLLGEAYFKVVLSERDRIREEWRNQHSIETKGDDKNLAVEEYLKAKFTELGNYKARIEDIVDQRKEMDKFNRTIVSVSRWLCGLGINRRDVSADDLMEQKELLQSMRAEDNSCSSTQAKNWRASSEDTIVASSEDNIVEDNIVASSADDICKLKRRKMDEC